MNQEFDYIIVGQGISGSLLAWKLIESGKKILVIDEDNPNASSKVAAGIIHPITGRRLVKTWMFDQAMPVAVKTYRELEVQFNDSFFKNYPIAELYDSVKTKNDWLNKCNEDETTGLSFENLNPDFERNISAPLGGMLIRGGGFLLISKLIERLYNYFVWHQCILKECFYHQELNVEKDHITYRQFKAGRIIFCEGYKATNNPYFQSLPFKPAKGEVLIIDCADLTDKYIFNKSSYILPLGNQLFKIGATYEWNDLNENTTAAAYEKLKNQFSEIVKVPFTVENHFAGIRPTIKDRRPITGFHDLYKNVGIINGLGTKGVLLAPMLVNAMVKHLTENEPINANFDVRLVFRNNSKLNL